MCKNDRLDWKRALKRKRRTHDGLDDAQWERLVMNIKAEEEAIERYMAEPNEPRVDPNEPTEPSEACILEEWRRSITEGREFQMHEPPLLAQIEHDDGGLLERMMQESDAAFAEMVETIAADNAGTDALLAELAERNDRSFAELIEAQEERRKEDDAFWNDLRERADADMDALMTEEEE